MAKAMRYCEDDMVCVNDTCSCGHEVEDNDDTDSDKVDDHEYGNAECE